MIAFFFTNPVYKCTVEVAQNNCLYTPIEDSENHVQKLIIRSIPLIT